MADFDAYSKEIQAVLKKLHAEAGQRVEVSRGDKQWTGAIMPRAGGDAGALVLKLENGYNIGIKFDKNVKIARAKEEKARGPETEASRKHPSVPVNLQKPTIAILHTGGTVASRLDYRTGGVVPLVTAEDIVEMYPELKDIANIRTRVLFQMFSEDMEPAHWAVIAREVYKELTEEGADGVIITHGTDTLYYTSAALAFMLRDLPVPVLLTASQRSSDRPSSAISTASPATRP
jgi:glutamyl-tRNA(Gln) amidotransferase subunit D